MTCDECKAQMHTMVKHQNTPALQDSSMYAVLKVRLWIPSSKVGAQSLLATEKVTAFPASVCDTLWLNAGASVNTNWQLQTSHDANLLCRSRGRSERSHSARTSGRR
eukprot:5715935-Amphidinium_carterae.1